MIAGAESQGVRIVHRRERFPIRGTKAEKRAERAVAACFVIAALAGVAFIVCLHRVAVEVAPAGHAAELPLLHAGPRRPDGRAAAVHGDRHRAVGEVAHARGGSDPGPPRRGVLGRGEADDRGHPGQRSRRHRPAAPRHDPEVARPRRRRTRDRPARRARRRHAEEARRPAAAHAVPPEQEDVPGHRTDAFRSCSRTGARSARTTSSPAASRPCSPACARRSTATTGSPPRRRPTLLIRLKPGQRVKSRKGQSGYGWPKESPEYVAYSKICTHAGCPASLYEQQTSRLLCPCHQSQFEVLEDAKPVFGPATRSLPKLPIDVVTGKDGNQYFVARDDYQEPIGPGFWERR